MCITWRVCAAEATWTEPDPQPLDHETRGVTVNFLGYRRPDGRVGTRNYVGVISTVVCANEVAKGIADKVSGAVAFTHQQGCCQTPPDL